MVEFFREGLEEMIGGRVNLVFCNEAEALGWGNTNDLQEAIAQLKQIADTFVITRGAQGAITFDGAEPLERYGMLSTENHIPASSKLIAGRTMAGPLELIIHPMLHTKLINPTEPHRRTTP